MNRLAENDKPISARMARRAIGCPMQNERISSEKQECSRSLFCRLLRPFFSRQAARPEAYRKVKKGGSY